MFKKYLKQYLTKEMVRLKNIAFNFVLHLSSNGYEGPRLKLSLSFDLLVFCSFFPFFNSNSSSKLGI